MSPFASGRQGEYTFSHQLESSQIEHSRSAVTGYAQLGSVLFYWKEGKSYRGGGRTRHEPKSAYPSGVKGDHSQLSLLLRQYSLYSSGFRSRGNPVWPVILHKLITPQSTRPNHSLWASQNRPGLPRRSTMPTLANHLPQEMRVQNKNCG